MVRSHCRGCAGTLQRSTMSERARAHTGVLIVLLYIAPYIQAWDNKPVFDADEEVEKRYSGELVEEYERVRDDALLIFTEFTARSAAEYKMFVRDLSSIRSGNDTGIPGDVRDDAPESCKQMLGDSLAAIERGAYSAASTSAVRHQYFYQGSMVVMKVHLNKTDNYIRIVKKNLGNCGYECETARNVMRWRKLAKAEINRVTSDMVYVRPFYRDLLAHFKRRLYRIRKGADEKVRRAAETFQHCVRNPPN